MTHTCHHRSGASSIKLIISWFRFGGIWFRKTVVEAALPCRGKVHWWWPGHRVHATILPHRHLLRHVLAQVDPRLRGGVLVARTTHGNDYAQRFPLSGQQQHQGRVAPVVSEKLWARRCAAQTPVLLSTQPVSHVPSHGGGESKCQRTCCRSILFKNKLESYQLQYLHISF